MKIGLTAYDVHAAEFLDLAKAADEAGFSSLWLGEHIVLPLSFTTAHPTKVQPGEQHHTGPIVAPDTELVDPLVQLGAAAAVTTRIELATGIFILPLRHPLAVARSTCTVQELAGGRFTLGLGLRLADRGVRRARRLVRRADLPLRRRHRGAARRVARWRDRP